MYLLAFLILFPVLIALCLLAVRNDTGRAVLVYGGGAVIACASITAVVLYLGKQELFAAESEAVNIICMVIGIAVAAIILVYGFKYRSRLAIVLAAIQVVGSVVFEVVFAPKVDVLNGLYIDSLSVLMTFIIGVIGSGICIYALGYMTDFQAHEPEEAKDRRNIFFALMFLFLGAMFLIVFSNNLSWLFTGWEVTTVCSFLLIGYTRTQEAIRNAFRQIIMNLLGGLGFLLALYLCAIDLNTLSLDEFIAYGVSYPMMVALPAVGLAFAGLTKAAQMPFHTWLLGAMVAPTPTSALLHSSTMVKAGVFLLVKLSPVFLVCVVPQVMVILVGGFTFLMCSLLAITQSNGKRVLAYSTIANLGLITACAGVGTPEAVWAACFLILFHACAKSLLFLCVGTAEHHIGSRDIEDMDLLFQRMPRLARYMMVGIMAMFIAPFGMLIAKWATLVSFVNMQHIILILMLGFGSAATFMFWAKWLGKLSGIAGQPDNVETTVHRSEWIATTLMLALIVVFTLAIPLVSHYVVEPYISQAYGAFGQLSAMLTAVAGNYLSDDNLWVCSICALVVFVVMFAGLGRSKAKRVNVYLAGASANNDERTFRDAMSGETMATSRNWYMERYFGEKKLTPFSTVFSSAVIIVSYIAAIAGVLGIL